MCDGLGRASLTECSVNALLIMRQIDKRSVMTVVRVLQGIVRPYVRSNNKIRVLYIFYDQ